MSALRSLILAAADSPGLQRFVRRYGFRLGAARFVAGESLDAAVPVLRRLNEQGLLTNTTLLGEGVRDEAETRVVVDAYREVLDRIHAEALQTNVALKLTHLGLSIDEELAQWNLAMLVEHAAQLGNFVRIDMEDRTTTDATLRIYKHLQERYGNVGVVLQAYMRRTLADIAAVTVAGANIRICKGIYVEPRDAAWKGYATVRANYLHALEAMIAQGVYAAIATHDEYLVCRAVALLRKHGVPRDRYEFQMLLGVDEPLRRILLAEGHRLRVYVPYGRDWYPYSIRRLRENPEVARHVLRAMLAGQ